MDIKDFDESLNRIQEKKSRRESGKYNSIMLPFERLSREFPGFEHNRTIICTANSGVGKTKLSKFLVLSIIEFMEKNPSVRGKIIYFLLEETKYEFICSIISMVMYKKFGRRIDTKILNSLGDFDLSDDILKEVLECRQWFERNSDKLVIVEDVTHPTGIHNEVKRQVELHGKIVKTPITDKDGKVVSTESVYVPNDPDFYLIPVVDHINELTTESGRDLRSTIEHMCIEYVRKKWRNKWNCTTILVQQQASLQEKEEFTISGKKIEEKLEPSLSGLGDCKTTQRTVDLVLGLFDPHRYGINEYYGYQINPSTGGIGPNFRCLLFLKDRHYGCANVRIPLSFYGDVNHFGELPHPEDINYSLYRK